VTGLLAKLETLVDELTGLVKEERARRAAPPAFPWLHDGQPWGIYGPRGTEIHFQTGGGGQPLNPNIQIGQEQ
jgi:hypothetical protein